jgi:hypothetical protein
VPGGLRELANGFDPATFQVAKSSEILAQAGVEDNGFNLGSHQVVITLSCHPFFSLVGPIGFAYPH